MLIHLRVCPSIYQRMYLYMYLHVYMRIYRCMYLRSGCPCICIYVYILCISVCICVRVWVCIKVYIHVCLKYGCIFEACMKTARCHGALTVPWLSSRRAWLVQASGRNQISHNFWKCQYDIINNLSKKGDLQWSMKYILMIDS